MGVFLWARYPCRLIVDRFSKSWGHSGIIEVLFLRSTKKKGNPNPKSGVRFRVGAWGGP